MEIRLNESEDASRLELDGVMDISSAAELKAALVQAIAARKGIRVSAEAVTGMDVTAYQLLWAARREAMRSGLQFALTGPIAEAVRGTMAEMGLDPCAVFD
jgi:anti-anti-sigma factor